jgi:hypothetical protein
MAKLLRITYMLLAATSLIPSTVAGLLYQTTKRTDSCICTYYIGTLCDFETNGGLLAGNYVEDALYGCSSSNAPAQLKAYCALCRRETQLGTDYCAL